MANMIGEIIQVIGPVIDVSFEETGDKLPSIYEALEITRDNGQRLIIEVQQHVGEHTVRTIAMDSTDGLQRGILGQAIQNSRIQDLVADHHPNQKSHGRSHSEYLPNGLAFAPETFCTPNQLVLGVHGHVVWQSS